MKRFNIIHERSANKVGVDGVLAGAWCDIPAGAERILDAGCGCGLIALMLAQRTETAEILGIDIDEQAVEEARANADASPWGDRLEMRTLDISRLIEEVKQGETERFDLIVSNPPFFHSGVEQPEGARMMARHAGGLSPERLIESAPVLLREDGRLAFIAEYSSTERLLRLAGQCELVTERTCIVAGNPQAHPKRTLFEMRLISPTQSERVEETIEERLTIENAPGEYTDDYRRLCKPFYIIFDD